MLLHAPQLATQALRLPTSATTAVLPTIAALPSAANSASVRRNASLSACSSARVMLDVLWGLRWETSASARHPTRNP